LTTTKIPKVIDKVKKNSRKKLPYCHPKICYNCSKEGV